jgi:very-short-patch-repair endonuclease
VRRVSADLDPTRLSLARERLERLFAFLREFDRLRHPVVRDVAQVDFRLWLDELPEHESVERGWLDDEAEFVLRVARPTLTDCPEPPRVLADWIEHGWQDPATDVLPQQEIRHAAPVFGDPDRVEQFEDDPERVSAFRAWSTRREEWAETERPARHAMAAFERIYRLHGLLERERERFELYAGDAILDCNTRSGRVHHPIVLQVMQLEFEAALPRFTISFGDRPPELYTALLRSIEEIDGRALGRATDEFAEGDYGPFSASEIDGFLQGMAARLHTRGAYVANEAVPGQADAPAIGRRPLLFLRQRTQGFAVALEAIAQDLPEREDLPNSLLSIVGIEPATSSDSPDDPIADAGQLASEDPDILFTKPANEEQAHIARRLERHRAVMVQGPPGTGKTHTIANLIGHLLAQGKRVLVTSQTAKALERVREVIVPDLQPLAVSVAGGDAVGRAQLEQSVQAITNRLSGDNANQLRGEAARLQQRRQGLIDELKQARRALHGALAAEYTDIVIGGSGVRPSDAAREVARGRGSHDWIPGPVSATDLALTIQEVIDLYRTNTSVTAEHERELSEPLPPLDDLLPPQRLQALIDEERQLEASDREMGRPAWRQEPVTESADAMEQLAVLAEAAAGQIRDLGDWELAVLDGGLQGGGFREVWEEILARIREAQELAERAAPQLARRGPRLPDSLALDEVARILLEIHAHLGGGGSLSRWVMITHRDWNKTLDMCSVEVGSTRDVEAVAALLALADLETARERLRGFWRRIAHPAGLPPDSSLGPAPERAAAQFAPRIRQLLDWHGDTWRPLIRRAGTLGLEVQTLFALSAPRLEQHGDLQRLVDVAGIHMPATLAALSRRMRLGAVQDEITGLDERLGRFDRGRRSGDAVPAMREAIRLRSANSYERQYQHLVDLHSRTRDARTRNELLTRLERTAPGWASAIRLRRDVHGRAEPPGDVATAWRWCVLSDEIERRTAIDPSALMAQIEQLDDDLRRVTAELVNRLAWASQLERTSLEQRQNLIGWMQAMSRVGRGTGKRAPRLLAAARDYMAQSRSAVPVWIMPLSRVVETFDFRTTRFDVVIIDEASQSDVLAMVALYLADQVVIVGDHEQVSPEAVGQRVEQFERLIDQFLRDIPNRELYDGRASIYDFGLSSFGGLVQLREHFRCVPEIIEFSNQLSYRGSILPLRDASDVRRRPHVIAERVAGHRDGMVNQAEADIIVSTILAACEFEEYQDATFGVISMLEDRQGRLIDSMLRQRMSPAEFERRRVLVGSPPQFQGDERQVVFLSLVDSPTGGPLPMRQDDRFKKRYNVAASRAQDQMWVVHSLDAERDLQPMDLRERLIRHAMSPTGVAQQIAQSAAKADSPFEEAVAADLIRAGYRIRAQHQVGAFRIDLVAQGENGRVAIECDGDRFHTREELARDLSRQALLERLGWRFVRIRGSEYFRDADRTMALVRERLEALGIRPDTTVTGDEPPTSDLLDRVRARAAEIRLAWEATDEDFDDLNPTEEGIDAEPATEPAGIDGDATGSLSPPDSGAPAVDKSIRVAAKTTYRSPAEQAGVRFPASSLPAGEPLTGSAPSLPRSSLAEATPSDPFLQPYRQWIPPTQMGSDPVVASGEELIHTLVEVVGVEGPIVGWRAYRLINRAAGRQRLGKQSVRALNRAAAAALRRGLIAGTNPFGQPGQAHLVLRLPDSPLIALRARGARELDEMPPDEIALHARRLRARVPDASSEELKRMLLEAYGWQRLTTNVSAFLGRCIALTPPELPAVGA